MSRTLPFNRPGVVGRELDYVSEALASSHYSGDGPFTRHCHELLAGRLGVGKALLTHSGTAALEMAALLCDLGPGDEVVMPSFTFPSTANAVALRGATPVFVDIRPDTLNLDESLIEQAITSRTRAIFVVHYAGVPCEMDEITTVAARHGLKVVEDAAQALGSTYRGRPAGALADMAAFSFHETKNVLSGEGGAFVTDDAALGGRAEILREKGTNRSAFFRGEIDKYTWVDLGSSFLPSEITAAVLFAQLETLDTVNRRRLTLWRRYHEAFADLEADGLLRRPVIPGHVGGNGHMYYLLLPDAERQQGFIASMKQAGILTPFHYLPLDRAPAGQRYARAGTDLPVTHDAAYRLVRLPLYYSLDDEAQDYIIDTARAAAGSR